MRMRIVMQLSGKMASLFTRLWAWLTTRLWSHVSSLLARFFRKYQNVRNQRLLLALTMSNFNHWRVNLIIVGQLIKAGLSTVKTKVIQIGLLLLTIVRQIRQLVITAYKKSKDLVVKMKSGA
jgi:hypothetical protein